MGAAAPPNSYAPTSQPRRNGSTPITLPPPSNAANESGKEQDRTLPQLRADALTGLLTGTDDTANPAVVPGLERIWQFAEVQVVVSADTLTGTATVREFMDDQCTDLAAASDWTG